MRRRLLTISSIGFLLAISAFIGICLMHGGNEEGNKSAAPRERLILALSGDDLLKGSVLVKGSALVKTAELPKSAGRSKNS